MKHFLDLTLDADALEHQRRRGSHDHYAAARARPAPERLGDAEIEFLSRRDSFYLASVGADGWPYVQHRGGPAGFVKIVDPTHLAWAERTGNRQYITAGHIDHDERVAIIAVDYPNRQRLKLLGHARFDPHPRADLLQRLDIDGRLERLVTVLPCPTPSPRGGSVPAPSGRVAVGSRAISGAGSRPSPTPELKSAREAGTFRRLNPPVRPGGSSARPEGLDDVSAAAEN